MYSQKRLSSITGTHCPKTALLVPYNAIYYNNNLILVNYKYVGTTVVSFYHGLYHTTDVIYNL